MRRGGRGREQVGACSANVRVRSWMELLSDASTVSHSPIEELNDEKYSYTDASQGSDRELSDDIWFEERAACSSCAVAAYGIMDER